MIDIVPVLAFWYQEIRESGVYRYILHFLFTDFNGSRKLTFCNHVFFKSAYLKLIRC